MVMLLLKERPASDVMILDVCGTIAAGTPELELRDKVWSILYRGHRKVLLNLAEATSSDASGVSAFLGALLDARDAGADLRLVHVTTRIDDLRIIVALYRYFTVFESEDDALASFCAERAVSAADGGWLEPATAI
jgi:anti-anti-sigma factor